MARAFEGTSGTPRWNIEYRRVGSGGGYPATLEDVARRWTVPRICPQVVVGHSAGGHLAAWAAERTPARLVASPACR